MTRPIVTIGYPLMRLAEAQWQIDWRSSPTAEATTGFTQTVYSAFPRWVGTVNLLIRRDMVGKWRSAMWEGQGRSGIYRLPMIDPAVFNRMSVLTESQALQGIPFSSGSYFSTGYGFDAGPFIPTTEAAAAGATEIRVTVAEAALVPVAGQILSADDWPMGVTYVLPEGEGVYRLGIQMPLRAAIAEGAPVRLVAMGRFEVLDDLAGQPGYGASPISTYSLKFREVLNR